MQVISAKQCVTTVGPLFPVGSQMPPGLNATTVACRLIWSSNTQSNHSRVVDALLAVVRRYLTPAPTSTNIERLFSYGGMVLEDRRASMNPDKVDKILFLRENIVLTNFQLDWD